MKLLFGLCAAILLLQGMQASADAGISHISEGCGNWVISFDWPALEEYSKSISRSESETGTVKVYADTLTMTTISDQSNVVKVTITKYPARDKALANSSSLMAIANKALSKSSICGDVKEDLITIDGKPGVFVSGPRCSGIGEVYVAAYPVDYFFDKFDQTPVSNAVSVVASTCKPEITECLINSIHIEQSSLVSNGYGQGQRPIFGALNSTA